MAAKTPLIFETFIFSKTIQSHAVFGYSYSDKLLLGYSINSYRYAKLKGWYYHMMPMYSFSANKILGEASLGYNLIPSSGPQNIRFEVSIKSFDRFYQKILDYRERYIKVQPAVIINFSEPILPTKSQLILRSVLLWEEKVNLQMKVNIQVNLTNRLLFSGRIMYIKSE